MFYFIQAATLLLAEQGDGRYIVTKADYPQRDCGHLFMTSKFFNFDPLGIPLHLSLFGDIKTVFKTAVHTIHTFLLYFVLHYSKTTGANGDIIE